MGGGVFEGFDLVERPRDDAPATHDHRADGNLARLVSTECLTEGVAHEMHVAVQIDDRRVVGVQDAKIKDEG